MGRLGFTLEIPADKNKILKLLIKSNLSVLFDLTDKLSALEYVGHAQSTWQLGAACPTAGMLISGKMVERLKLTKEPVCACKSMLKLPC